MFIRVLGRIKSRQAAQALANLMAEILRTDPEAKILGSLVSAFGGASGKWFSSSAGTDQGRARKALQWWCEQ